MQPNENDPKSAFIQGLCVALHFDSKIKESKIKLFLQVLKSDPSLLEAEVFSPYKEKLALILKRGFPLKTECLGVTSMVFKILGIDPPAQDEEEKATIDEVPFDDIALINFRGSAFVTTGQFRLCRNAVEEFIKKAGGEVRGSCSPEVDYLIVGSIPDPGWKFGGYGTKVRAAIELKERGHGILIITEDAFKTITQMA